MNSPQDKAQDVRDVPAELQAWWPEQMPENTNMRCRNGCCRGPYCAQTYEAHGAAAAIVEAYTPLKQGMFERLRAKFTRKAQSKGKP